MKARAGRLLGLIGPGLLIAATGVGAGDLATASFAAGKMGYAVLWAIVVGAAFKYVLTEGLARWQLATGESLLHGAMTRLGWVPRVVFIVYLLPFSFFVGAALMSACGVTTHALVPVFDDPGTAKIVFGIAHSIGALVLLRLSGFVWFERAMGACVALMCITMVASAVLIAPDWGAVGRGLVVPRIPTEVSSDARVWTVGLMGGVGGTLTVLCYGYWIREQGRTGEQSVRACRVDLAVGYAVTALFGIATAIVASGVAFSGRGALLVVELADHLGEQVGAPARWVFLVGAWATVTSSLLGVWQAVPYLFADYWRIVRRGEGPAGGDLKGSKGYRVFQLALAVVPIAGMVVSFRQAQLLYVITGAAFLPALAFVLLVMNGRVAWVGERHRNKVVVVVALFVILMFFAANGYLELLAKLRGGVV